MYIGLRTFYTRYLDLFLLKGYRREESDKKKEYSRKDLISTCALFSTLSLKIHCD